MMALSVNVLAGDTPIGTKTDPPPPPPPGGEFCIVIDDETIQEPINEEKSFIDWLLGSLGVLGSN